MTKSLLWDLMLWAAMLSQQPMPDALPDIEYVSSEYIESHFCDSTKDCHVEAMYVPGPGDVVQSGTVYILDQFEDSKTVYTASIIVHEFVHYLQDRGGMISTDITCEQWWNNERNAYRVQALFLKKHHAIVFISRELGLRDCSPG